MERYIVKTDGGARGNPGPAGAGAVLFSADNEVMATAKEFIERATNNEAEYQGVVLGLKLIKKTFGQEKSKKIGVDFFLDSELVVRQLNGEYQIKEERLWPFFMHLWNARVKDFPNLTFSHIKRQENKLADQLVNDILDEKGF